MITDHGGVCYTPHPTGLQPPNQTGILELPAKQTEKAGTMITISRRNATVAAAIVAAGIIVPSVGLAAASTDAPTVVTYEDGSFTVDYHDGSAPAVGYLPDSTAAND